VGGSSASTTEAAYPAAGAYVYRQRGFEEFCTGSCDKHPLPRTNKVMASYTQHSHDSATVVTKDRSPDRYVRTTTDFTSSGASIAEVYFRSQYSGVKFSNDYRLQPPAESLRFPLTAGERWSGSWKAGMSGDYRVSVLGRETVTAAGTRVNAFKISTITHFRGDYQGKAAVTVWIDPATKAIVRTSGALSLKNSFGSYDSTFQTLLTNAPGYS
jgi:hypothetical protein